MFGFGYDTSCDDYVVVAISRTGNPRPGYGLKKDDGGVYVYMLKTSKWKKVGVSPFNHKLAMPSSGYFVEGSLHWLAKYVNDFDSRILIISAFNVANKEFSQVPVPHGVLDITFSNFSSLGVLKGCLCVINIDDSFSTGLWVMKEYGVVESWIKLSIVTDKGISDVPLHLREDNLVVTDYCMYVLVVTGA